MQVLFFFLFITNNIVGCCIAVKVCTSCTAAKNCVQWDHCDIIVSLTATTAATKFFCAATAAEVSLHPDRGTIAEAQENEILHTIENIRSFCINVRLGDSTWPPLEGEPSRISRGGPKFFLCY